MLWHQSPAVENLQKMHSIWQFSMNLIKMEDDFLSVWYALEIDLLNVLFCQHYLQHSQTFALKNRMLFQKLNILETYNYIFVLHFFRSINNTRMLF